MEFKNRTVQYPNRYKMVKVHGEDDIFELLRVEGEVDGEGTQIDDGFLKSYMLENVYPIGSVYISVSEVSPSILLGYGTWERISEGRLLVGTGTGTDKNSVQKTYSVGTNSDGEYQHTQTVQELASHNHGIYGQYNIIQPENDEYILAAGTWAKGYGNYSGAIRHSGGNAPMNITNPTYGVFIWKRIG